MATRLRKQTAANGFADIYKGFNKLVRNISQFRSFFLKEDCANWNEERRWFTTRRRGRVPHTRAAQISCNTCMFNYKPPSWNEINYYLFRLRASVANQLALAFLSGSFQKVWNERRLFLISDDWPVTRSDQATWFQIKTLKELFSIKNSCTQNLTFRLVGRCRLRTVSIVAV